MGASKPLATAEVAWLTTPEGAQVPLTLKEAESIFAEAVSSQKGKAPSLKPNVVSKNIASEQVQWTPHGFKHSPPKNVSWREIVKSTAHGDALYKPNVNIRELELHAWQNGQKVVNEKNWKVFKSDEIIGAKNGQETCFMRIECSANTVHGHPISESEYLRYLNGKK